MATATITFTVDPHSEVSDEQYLEWVKFWLSNDSHMSDDNPLLIYEVGCLEIKDFKITR